MDILALLAHAKPYWRPLVGVIVLSLLASLASLVLPALAAQLLSGLVLIEMNSLGQIAALLVATLAVMTALRVASAMISSRVANAILADLRARIHSHLLRLPMSFHDQSRQGDILALMTAEVARLSAFISGTLAAAPSALLTALGAIIILLAIDPLLAILLPLLAPAYVLALKIIGRRMRIIGVKVQQAEADIMAQAEEDLHMLGAMKSFAREEAREGTYWGVVDRARSLRVKEETVAILLGSSLSLITALAALTVILLAIKLNDAGPESPYKIFSFLLYTALATGPIQRLASLYGQMQATKGTLQRLQAVLNEPREAGYSFAERPSACLGTVSFRDVWFDYPGREGTLRGVDLEIEAGEIVALTGENGAGKSTIVSLLMGLYLPQVGEIRLDGQLLSQYNVQQLRRRIGYVPQRALLFNGTVAENILLGRSDISQREVTRAIELAQADTVIRSLPAGLDTVIGDHGVRLSGGQRQRIALARALVGDPRILIFDEATAMFDLEGEAALVEACKTALLERTVIIVTHRPASLSLADRIVTIADGCVAKVDNPTRIIGSVAP
jgi:ATP-binding cassette subfamily B protein/subfamily B ATP-binding cassette protein MsbA